MPPRKLLKEIKYFVFKRPGTGT